MAKWDMKDKPAKVDLRTIDKPFGELDERTQRRLQKADASGWPIEFRNPLYVNDTWGLISNPGFAYSLAYRLDPTFTPPPKRRVVWIINNVAFDSSRSAKIAYPGSDPVKFKECKE